MNITREILREIISEEMKTISEGCGCGCAGAPGGCGGSKEDIKPLPDYEDSMEDHSSEFMSRDESLKAVVAIAMSTSCPLTRDALLSVVEDLL